MTGVVGTFARKLDVLQTVSSASRALKWFGGSMKGGFSFMVLLYENTKKVGRLNIYSNTELTHIYST